MAYIVGPVHVEPLFVVAKTNGQGRSVDEDAVVGIQRDFQLGLRLSGTPSQTTGDKVLPQGQVFYEKKG